MLFLLYHNIILLYTQLKKIKLKNIFIPKMYILDQLVATNYLVIIIFHNNIYLITVV